MNALLVADGENQEFLREGPGSYLRELREERGWSLEYAAQQLHLDEDVVDALECNDFDHLPSPVFVRGYLSKYARVLDVAADPVLRAYQDICPASDVSQNLRAGSAKLEVSSSQPVMRGVSLLVAAVMVVMLLLWWQGYLQRSNESAGEEVAAETERPLEPQPFDGEAPPAGEMPSRSELGEPEIIEMRIPGREQVAIAPNKPGAASAGEPVVEDAAGDAATVSSLPAGEDGEQGAGAAEESDVTAAPAQPASEPAEQETPAVAESVPAEDEAAAAADAPGFRVEFRFIATSWVDVRDAEGHLLIIGEEKAGSRRELTDGKPPFKVVLGRAEGVRLTVNGKAFDLAPHTRKNVARFTLSKQRLGID